MIENYYDALSLEEKQKWDEHDKHLWEVDFPEQLHKDRAMAEAEWSKRNRVWAWIGAPDWNFGFAEWYFLKHPKHACRRIIRLSLPDDGQLRIIQTFWDYHDPRFYWHEACTGEKCFCNHQPTYPMHEYTHYDRLRQRDPDEKFYTSTEVHLTATARGVDGSLHRFYGTLEDTPHFEMGASGVVFNSSTTPQIVADNCAKILDLSSEGNGENFYALLDGTNRCAFCQKPLRDPISKLVSVGPDCAKQYNIPHTLEAANKRLALRKKLLAEMAAPSSH